MPPRPKKGFPDSRNYLKALGGSIVARRNAGIYATVKSDGKAFSPRKINGAARSIWRQDKSSYNDIFIEELRLSGSRQDIINAINAVDGKAPDLSKMIIYDWNTPNLPQNNPTRRAYEAELALAKSRIGKGKKDDSLAWLEVISKVYNLLTTDTKNKSGQKKKVGKKTVRSASRTLKQRYDQIVADNLTSDSKRVLNVSEYDKNTGNGARQGRAASTPASLFAADPEGVLVSNNRAGIRNAAKAIFGQGQAEDYVEEWKAAGGTFATLAAAKKARNK